LFKIKACEKITAPVPSSGATGQAKRLAQKTIYGWTGIREGAIMFIIWLTRGLRVLIIFSVLTGCTYQKTHTQSKLQKLPVPVTVKPEPATMVSETPSAIVPSPPIPVPRFYTHRVRWKGETLFIISKWYTGSGKNWKALSKFNPKLNPNLMIINENIFIPEDLMKSRKPMPLSFLSSFIRKKSASSFQANNPSNENHVTEIFGPIESESSSIESATLELYGPVENDPDFIDSETIELFKPIE
jgi:hypothetical protein